MYDQRVQLIGNRVVRQAKNDQKQQSIAAEKAGQYQDIFAILAHTQHESRDEYAKHHGRHMMYGG